MTLALRSPNLLSNIVSVDNAPVRVALVGNFARYIEGMEKIDQQSATSQTQADKILQEYEEVDDARC